jgi:exodeoxyribonuclease-5
MTQGVTLTDHQKEKLDQLLALPFPIVALRGLAGTGKTSVIPEIVRRLPNAVVCAPTNRAAMVLQKKGLYEAVTLHKACLRPYFTEVFENLKAWTENPNTARLPALIAKIPLERIQKVLAEAKGSSDAILQGLNINPMDHIAGWTARDMEALSTLIIDEASMVGYRLLEEAQKLFGRIILIGDPGQLAPVQDSPVLNDVPGVELSEVHRQAQDSPIIKFAYDVRNATEHEHVDYPSGIERTNQFDPKIGPIIVWTNKTRKGLNVGMRHHLGLPPKQLTEGEPLVCKANTKKHAARGLVNNSLWTYVRPGVVKDDVGRETELEDMWVEGINDGDPSTSDCKFQLGYAITAHTAQGSEWPTVQVYAEEVMAAEQAQGFDFTKQFLYTAVTRAKDRLIMVHASSCF